MHGKRCRVSSVTRDGNRVGVCGYYFFDGVREKRVRGKTERSVVRVSCLTELLQVSDLNNLSVF